MQDQIPLEPALSAIERAVLQHLGRTGSLQVNRVTEGGEHAAWFVGEHYIFRALPHSQDSIAALKKEIEVRDLVRQRQDDATIIPDFMGTITVNGWIGNLDVRVKGASLEERHATTKTETDLVRFVKALWATPVAAAEAMVESERETVELDDLIADAHQAWSQLLKTGYATGYENIMATLLEISDGVGVPNKAEREVLLHNDFKAEHIILRTSNDDNDGALAGVIDWSDAAIGDVAVDVDGLAISVGRHMAERIALEAGVSHSAVKRGIAAAMCDSVININERINGDDRDSPEWVLRRQFQRAFEGTALENALV
jgi:aminoglycoside phosphotransferase (APT) family kinase protein